MGDSHTCLNCQNQFEVDMMVPYQNRWVCVNCKPAFFQMIQEGITPVIPVQGEYGGFWIRFLARVIDSIIVSFLSWGLILLILLPFGMLDFSALVDSGGELMLPIYVNLIIIVLAYGLPCAYETYMVGRYNATFGKMALGLKVYRSDGANLSYMRSFGRYWGTVLSGMFCAIGYIIAAFDEEKRTLHDNLADTRVFRGM